MLGAQIIQVSLFQKWNEKLVSIHGHFFPSCAEMIVPLQQPFPTGHLPNVLDYNFQTVWVKTSAPGGICLRKCALGIKHSLLPCTITSGYYLKMQEGWGQKEKMSF